MDIESVFLLIEAIIRQANTDANTKNHSTASYPRTCLATNKEHPARDCAKEFLVTMSVHKDVIEYCFGVTELWQQ